MSVLKDWLGTWYEPLQPVLTSPEFQDIGKQIALWQKKGEVYPATEDIFKAFRLSTFENTKVVIIGQDPYHTPGMASGLAFGVKNANGKIPPSLQVIRQELNAEYQSENADFDYTLESWAKQGVLLLNTALTVQKGQAGSHSNEWLPITTRIIDIIGMAKTGLVFMLWGKHAQSLESMYMKSFNHVLKAAHPAAELRRSNAGFLGCNHFKMANEIINGINGKEHEIKWI